MAASGLPIDTLKIGPGSTQPTAMQLFTQLLNQQGYYSATGDPLDPRARTVAVGAGSDRSFDRYGGGFGPGFGRGGPGGVDMRQFFGGGNLKGTGFGSTNYLF